MSIDPAYMAAESLQKDLTEIAKGIEKKHRVASVIIMVTYQDGERCRSINGRAGNYYASYGASPRPAKGFPEPDQKEGDHAL